MNIEPIYCMVIAQASTKELDEFAQAPLRRQFPFETPRHDWEFATGVRHAALISREPGTAGSDWHLAEKISKARRGEPVYSLWFDPEISNIVEWRNGKQVRDLPGPPADFARSLGFEIDAVTDPPPDTTFIPSVAVIEAPIDEVRRVLGTRADEPWLRLDPAPIGTIVSADDSNLGLEHYHLSVAMPEVIVYRVFRDGDEFGVQAMKGGEETTSFYLPPFPSETAVPEMFGVRTREEILAKLGIAPALLGY